VALPSFQLFVRRTKVAWGVVLERGEGRGTSEEPARNQQAKIEFFLGAAFLDQQKTNGGGFVTRLLVDSS